MAKKEIPIEVEINEKDLDCCGYHKVKDNDCVSTTNTDHLDDEWTTTHTLCNQDIDNPYNKLKCDCECNHKDWSECDEHFCDGPENDDDDKEGYAFAYLNEENDNEPQPHYYDINEDDFEMEDEDDDYNYDVDDIHSFNVGNSDYSVHKIQPWDIWEEYDLNPWEADIVKRVLREKHEPGMSFIDSRIMDFKKIIHVARKCIELLEKDKNSLPEEY